MPTELQFAAAQACRDARAFYKHGVKGANKRYDPNLAYPPWLHSKVQRRGQGAAIFEQFYRPNAPPYANTNMTAPVFMFDPRDERVAV